MNPVCPVCFDRPAATVAFACGGHAVCEPCALRCRACPLCRAERLPPCVVRELVLDYARIVEVFPLWQTYSTEEKDARLSGLANIRALAATPTTKAVLRVRSHRAVRIFAETPAKAAWWACCRNVE